MMQIQMLRWTAAALVGAAPWLAGCSTLYSPARDQQGQEAKAAWSQVDLAGQIATARANHAALLQQQLTLQDQLMGAHRDQLARALGHRAGRRQAHRMCVTAQGLQMSRDAPKVVEPGTRDADPVESEKSVDQHDRQRRAALRWARDRDHAGQWCLHCSSRFRCDGWFAPQPYCDQRDCQSDDQSDDDDRRHGCRRVPCLTQRANVMCVSCSRLDANPAAFCRGDGERVRIRLRGPLDGTIECRRSTRPLDLRVCDQTPLPQFTPQACEMCSAYGAKLTRTLGIASLRPTQEPSCRVSYSPNGPRR